MLRVGVVGFGYWGPNLVRNFAALPDVRVTAICDLSEQARLRAQTLYPQIECCASPDTLLSTDAVDAVAIATPVSTHHALVKKAICAGKHVFVEKPFTATVAEAEELVALAATKRSILMVDHTFLFSGAVRKIKEILDRGELGDVYYYDSTRVNLGLFQPDVNVVWDLAPHDFSIVDYLLGRQPISVAATGMDHFNRELENLAYITVRYESNLIAHFNLNWLSPVKVRTTMIGGSRKMLMWDDMQSHERVKVYDSHVNVQSREGAYDCRIQYRTGDMWSPRVPPTEALALEARYFVDCIAKNERPFNDEKAGLRVVKLLDAADRSLRNGGEVIQL